MPPFEVENPVQILSTLISFRREISIREWRMERPLFYIFDLLTKIIDGAETHCMSLTTLMDHVDEQRAYLQGKKQYKEALTRFIYCFHSFRVKIAATLLGRSLHLYATEISHGTRDPTEVQENLHMVAVIHPFRIDEWASFNQCIMGITRLSEEAFQEFALGQSINSSEPIITETIFQTASLAYAELRSIRDRVETLFP